MTTAPLLAVSNLTITVGPDGPAIVRDAALHVRSGEIAAIVGESGSGKTMAARAVLDLLPPPLGPAVRRHPLPRPGARRARPQGHAGRPRRGHGHDLSGAHDLPSTRP